MSEIDDLRIEALRAEVAERDADLEQLRDILRSLSDHTETLEDDAAGLRAEVARLNEVCEWWAANRQTWVDAAQAAEAKVARFRALTSALVDVASIGHFVGIDGKHYFTIVDEYSRDVPLDVAVAYYLCTGDTRQPLDPNRKHPQVQVQAHAALLDALTHHHEETP